MQQRQLTHGAKLSNPVPVPDEPVLHGGMKRMMPKFLLREQALFLTTLYAGICGLVFCSTTFGATGADPDQEPETASGRRLPDEETSPLYGIISLTADSVSNLSGGKRTGTALESLLHVGGAVDGVLVGLPRGGRFKLSVVYINSQRPSLNYIGDAQVASNTSAATAIRVDQIWYRQDLAAGTLRLRAGIIDLNQYFDVMENAQNLVNSSFGVSPAISANAPISIYPKPGFGAMLRWGRGDSALRAAVFQGNPDRRNGLFNDGRTMIGEWQPLGAAPDGNSTAVKLGLWQCRCETGSAPAAELHTWGWYGSVQESVFRRKGKAAVLFLHVAASPGSASTTPFAAAAGVNVPAPFAHRPDDAFSVGATRQSLRHLPAETSYEVTYVLSLAHDFSLQPDLQYVVNPSGVYPDAWVFLLRAHFYYDTDF